MIYLILDTNIWLYLANGLDPSTGKHSEDNHFELLRKLKNHSQKNEIKVLINEIIIKEFNRNREHSKTYINKLKNKIKDGHAQVFNEIKKYSKKHLLINELEKEYKQAILNRIKLNEAHITDVENFLLHECTLIDISNDLKVQLVDMALERKAPFHNDKNNFADACILFSADNFLSKGMPYRDYDKAIFVSNNYNEFCNKNNHNKFHQDIIEKIETDILSFDRFLPSALHLSTSLIAEMNDYFESLAVPEDKEFECKSTMCYRSEFHNPFGFLKMKFIKTSDDQPFYDPNQLELFPKTYPRPKREPQFVSAGECEFCSSLHIECPGCEELLTDFDTDETIVCPHCETNFIIDLNSDNVHIMNHIEEDTY